VQAASRGLFGRGRDPLAAEGDRLSVRGIILETVDYISETSLQTLKDDARLLSYVSNFARRRGSRAYPLGIPILQVLYRLPLLDPSNGVDQKILHTTYILLVIHFGNEGASVGEALAALVCRLPTNPLGTGSADTSSLAQTSQNPSFKPISRIYRQNHKPRWSSSSFSARIGGV
jgi:hypothetical protein